MRACIPSVGQERLLLTRSGSGDPELRSLGHVNDRGGQAPALRYARPSPFTVGRGPVPRHAHRLKQDFQDFSRLARFWGLMGRMPRGVPKRCRCVRDLILVNRDNPVNPAQILLNFFICNFNLTKSEKNCIINNNV